MSVLNLEQAVLHRGIIPRHEKSMAEGEAPGMIWRPGRRVRIGFSLTLGILAGIALLSIPALVTPANQASDTDTGGRISGFALSESLAGTETIPPASTTSDKLSLGLGLFLVLLPASVLSFLTRKWAVRKLQQF